MLEDREFEAMVAIIETALMLPEDTEDIHPTTPDDTESN